MYQALTQCWGLLYIKRWMWGRNGFNLDRLTDGLADGLMIGRTGKRKKRDHGNNYGGVRL